ncbi:hypothetical protein [Streptosporangium sp. NPDC051022]|uniref:hypothetical protein n=1 Tax=Streptosporangium sp. NPDC051022 TaxID=3155752 RepID=UPI003418A0AE
MNEEPRKDSNPRHAGTPEGEFREFREAFAHARAGGGADASAEVAPSEVRELAETLRASIATLNEQIEARAQQLAAERIAKLEEGIRWRDDILRRAFGGPDEIGSLERRAQEVSDMIRHLLERLTGMTVPGTGRH